jgi:hypothetical protein
MPTDRLELIHTLNGLPLVQFNALVFQLQPPAGLMPPSSAPQGDRVIAALNWAEGTGGCGLHQVQFVLQRILDSLPLPAVEAIQESQFGEQLNPATAQNAIAAKAGEPFNTHAQGEIRAYLQAHTPKTSRAKNQERSERLAFAAWRWLKIENTLERLGKIQEDTGLADMELSLFASKLREFCSDIEEEHPRLRFWILKRCALLEYKITNLAELPVDLATTGTSLNYSLFAGLMDYCDGASQLPQDRALHEVRRVAGETLNQALTAVGQIVCRTLSTRPSECEFRANLMLPAEYAFLDSALFSATQSLKNIQDARNLWGEPSEHGICLVVVAENNDKPEYLGFWLPALANCRNPSAGATTAYYKAKASAVFVDDPPLLFGEDLPAGSHSKWLEYLQKRFQQEVFVSIPFAIEVKGGQRRVPAIINVNVNPADHGDFRRAYHPEWLRIAQRETVSLVCEAHKAFVLSRATFR